MPFTIATPVHSELIIKKSRFIGCVQPMTDRASAQQVVNDLKAQHPGACHVCWALLAGGQSAAVDDGEPSGTAGRPMLDVLRHQDLEGVLATVLCLAYSIVLGGSTMHPAFAANGVAFATFGFGLSALGEVLQPGNCRHHGSGLVGQCLRPGLGDGITLATAIRRLRHLAEIR